MDYVEFFRILESYGLTEALLPFLLIFLIVFATTNRVKMFGEGRKNMCAIFALIIGLLVVIPHVLGKYPPGADVVDIMNSAIPQVSGVLIALVMFFVLVGMWGGSASWIVNRATGIVAIISFLSVVYIFGGSAGWWNDIAIGWWGPETTALIIIILVFALLIFWITKEPGDATKAGAFTNLANEFSGLFGGGKK